MPEHLRTKRRQSSIAGNCNARKPRAILKRISPDARHRIGKRHACEARTAVKSISPDARHATGDSDTRENRTAVKSISSYTSDRTGNRVSCIRLPSWIFD